MFGQESVSPMPNNPNTRLHHMTERKFFGVKILKTTYVKVKLKTKLVKNLKSIESLLFQRKFFRIQLNI